MVRIAIVEDDNAYREQLQRYVQRYQQEQGEEFAVSLFEDGLDITEDYSGDYDLILMDIQMKHMDGMEAARRIRAVDDKVILIFITNMAQFAIQGYQVEALSYVLKPIQYFAFSQELQKAVRKIQGGQTSYIHIFKDGAMLRLNEAKITYVEVQDHEVLYHVTDGTHRCKDTLKHVEEQLDPQRFSRCNNCYLVNLAYVDQVEGEFAYVAGEPLRISRPRRKKFMEALAAYIGGR